MVPVRVHLVDKGLQAKLSQMLLHKWQFFFDVPYPITTVVTKALCLCLANEHKVIWGDGCAWIATAAVSHASTICDVNLAGMPLFSIF